MTGPRLDDTLFKDERADEHQPATHGSSPNSSATSSTRAESFAGRVTIQVRLKASTSSIGRDGII